MQGVADEQEEVFRVALVEGVPVHGHVDEPGGNAGRQQEHAGGRDVVVDVREGSHRGSVGRPEVEGDVDPGGFAEADGEDRARGSGVLLDHPGVMDPEQRGVVVLLDAALPGLVAGDDARVLRVAEHQVEGLDRAFVDEVPQHVDGDGPVGLPLRNGEGPVRGDVVAAGVRRSVGGAEIDGDVVPRRSVEVEAEDGARGPGIGFGDGDVADVQERRIVVDDCPLSHGGRDRRVRRIVQANEERFENAFVILVAVDGHGKAAVRGAGGNQECAGGRGVVGPGVRRSVGRGIADGHVQ